MGAYRKRKENKCVACEPMENKKNIRVAWEPIENERNAYVLSISIWKIHENTGVAFGHVENAMKTQVLRGNL